MGIRNRRTYIYISRDSINMSKYRLARFARSPIINYYIAVTSLKIACFYVSVCTIQVDHTGYLDHLPVQLAVTRSAALLSSGQLPIVTGSAALQSKACATLLAIFVLSSEFQP